MNNLNKKKFDEAFKIFFKKLEDIEFEWVLTGTYRLLIESAEVNPSDIDILTSKKGVEIIVEQFSEYVISHPRTSKLKKLKSYYGLIKIGEVQFDIVGDIEERINNVWRRFPELSTKNLIKKEYEQMEIPVFRLEYEKEISRFFNKSKKEKIISKLLEK